MPTFRRGPLLVPVAVCVLACSCSSGAPGASVDAGRSSIDSSDQSTNRSSVNVTESSAVVLGSTTISGGTSALLSSAMASSVRATESSTTVASTRSASASSKSAAASTRASSTSPSASTASSAVSTESAPSGTGASRVTASASSSESHASTPSSSEQTGPTSTSSSGQYTSGGYECSVAEEFATVEVVDARTHAPVVDATLSLVQGGDVIAGSYAWNDDGPDGGLTGTYTVGVIGGYFVEYDSFLVSAPGYASQLVTEVTPGFPGEPRYCGGVATPTSAYVALIPLGVGEAGDGGLDGGTRLVEAGVSDAGGSGPTEACVRVKAFVSGEAVLTLRADTLSWQSITGCAPGLDPRCAGDSGPTELRSLAPRARSAPRGTTRPGRSLIRARPATRVRARSPDMARRSRSSGSLRHFRRPRRL